MTASHDTTAKKWDARSGAFISTAIHDGDFIASLQYDSTGSRVIISSDDGSAKIWAPEHGILLAQIRAHRGYLHTSAFSPDGTRVLTVSLDGTLKIWHSMPYGERYPDIRAARETPHANSQQP